MTHTAATLSPNKTQQRQRSVRVNPQRIRSQTGVDENKGKGGKKWRTMFRRCLSLSLSVVLKPRTFKTPPINHHSIFTRVVSGVGSTGSSRRSGRRTFWTVRRSISGPHIYSEHTIHTDTEQSTESCMSLEEVLTRSPHTGKMSTQYRNTISYSGVHDLMGNIKKQQQTNKQ